MTTPTLDERYGHLQVEVDNYTSTVKALLAFAACVVHDGTTVRVGSHFGFGRRMNTSVTNRVQPDNQVTPDLVAQKGQGYGVVAEAKRTLPADERRWNRYVRQLLKYDDDLEGWWTESEHVFHSDAVLLIHQARTRAFVRFLEKEAASGGRQVGPSAAVVEFNLSPEAKPFMFFRREWGKIADVELSKALEDGQQIPLEDVLRTFPSVKFYDAQPPLPWLMKELWTDLFMAMRDESLYDERSGEYRIPVTVEAVTSELQTAFGSGRLDRDERSASFPQAAWIRDAIEAFVRAGLAVPGANAGEYTVHFRALRGDILRRFMALLTPRSAKQRPPPPEQISLLNGSGEE